MKTKILLFAGLAAVCCATATAQVVTVKSVQPVKAATPAPLYHPVFTTDGASLLVTSEGYDGLSVLSLGDNTVRHLTTRAGTGYMPQLSADGCMAVVREFDYQNQKMSLFAIDLETAAETVIAQDIEHCNAVALDAGSLTLSQNGVMQCRRVASRRTKAPATAVAPSVYVTEEDLKPVLYAGGVRTVIDPLSTPDNDVNYCWTSLSPDGKRMAFVAGKDAYTCNLDGSGLVNVGPLRAPVWLDGLTLVGMLDSDDGHVFTASEILAVRADGSARQQLTSQSPAEGGAAIKMFPGVSPQGDRIAYHTLDGQIFIINLER